MEKMSIAHCVLLAALLSTAAMGQAPADLFQKAPPEVDTALRERVAGFLQAHVDGKLRLADQFVADESKDAFFEAHKRRYRDFEIAKVTYSENYTKAVVLAVCGTEIQFPMNVRPVPVKMPVTMYWKTVDGKWFWYLPPAPASYDTPFGKMKPGPDEPAGAGAPAGLAQAPSLAQLSQMVAVDKVVVNLSAAAPSAVVVLSSRMPGKVTASIEGAVPDGLDAKLDRPELKTGETANLTLQLLDAAKLGSTSYVVRLRVDPLNQVFPVRVNIIAPAKK
jgi:hypothetical protein